MFGLIFGLFASLVIVALLLLAFEIWMFIHAWQNQSIEPEIRLIWLVGMVLVHPFVAIAYYFTDYKKGP